MGTNPDFTLLGMNLTDVEAPEAIPEGLYTAELDSYEGVVSRSKTHGVKLTYTIIGVTEFDDPDAAKKAWPNEDDLLGKTFSQQIYSTKATPESPAGNPWRIKKMLSTAFGIDVDADDLTLDKAFEEASGNPVTLKLAREMDRQTNELRDFPSIVAVTPA